MLNMEELEAGGGICILVGDNGAGKSMVLRELANEYIRRGKHVLTIANTVNHRFKNSRQLCILSPKTGIGNPENLFKRALGSTRFEADGPLRNSRRIAKVMEYCGFRPLIGLHVRFENEDLSSPTLIDLITEKLERAGLSYMDIPTIVSAIRTFQYQSSGLATVWIDLMGSSFMGMKGQEILTILRFERKLIKAKIIKGISISVEKDSVVFNLNEASSGEISLFATHAFLASKIREGSVVLIDEPENSLHPQWQKEYCQKLLDLFSYSVAKAFIATHSPILVSAASTNRDASGIFRVSNGRPERLNDNAASVEGTLWESFDTLAPANHWLSELLSGMLEKLSIGELSLAEIDKSVDEFRKKSYDEKQKNFLVEFSKLARRVSQEAQTERRSGL